MIISMVYLSGFYREEMTKKLNTFPVETDRYTLLCPENIILSILHCIWIFADFLFVGAMHHMGPVSSKSSNINF